VNLHRSRELGYQALERHDRDQALVHQLDRLAPSRNAQWPKDDRRSSSRLDGADDGPRTRERS
jgi:hypothetical protein